MKLDPIYTPICKKYPSIDKLATLAAIMGKGPEDALRLWRASENLLEREAERDERDREKKTYSLQEALEFSGAHKKTFINLFRGYLSEVEKRDAEEIQEIVDNIDKKGLSHYHVYGTVFYRQRRNQERGRNNRLNVTKGKRRKPVK